jgi:hypothetical protein
MPLDVVDVCDDDGVEGWRKPAFLYTFFNNGGFPVKNCEMKMSGNILTITVDISKDFGKSSSGKSVIIASTEGNVSVPDTSDIKIGLNIYKKA